VADGIKRGGIDRNKNIQTKIVMKQLSQIIALYLFGFNGLQIILAAGITVLILKMFIDKILTARRTWIIRQRNREIESNMWAIE
jgi:hypothetical protein